MNYGDIEVNLATGHLLVVSSDENRIAEFTPGISLMQYLPLPAGVSSLSGIGYDDALGQIWVTNTSASSTIWRLGEQLLWGDYNDDGSVNAADYTVWRNNVGAQHGTLPNDINGGDDRPATIQYVARSRWRIERYWCSPRQIRPPM